jgi:hypothetical protein
MDLDIVWRNCYWEKTHTCSGWFCYSHRRFCCVNKCQLVMDCGDTLFDQLGLAAFDTEKRAVFLVLDTCVVTMIRNRVEWLPRTNSSLCRLVALHADIKCNVAQYYSYPPNYIRLNLQSSLTLLNEIIPLISWQMWIVEFFRGQIIIPDNDRSFHPSQIRS